MYCLDTDEYVVVDLLASGAILREARAAAEYLKEHANIGVRVWSVTSWSELARQAHGASLNDESSYLETLIHEQSQLVVGVSDYVRAVPGLLSEYIKKPYYTLGTDGFGMSDTRQELRKYYGVDQQSIATFIVEQMLKMGLVDHSVQKKFIRKSRVTNTLEDDRRSI